MGELKDYQIFVNMQYISSSDTNLGLDDGLIEVIFGCLTIVSQELTLCLFY